VCGIVATLGPEPAEPGALADACRALAHRGPDGEGTWAGKAGRWSPSSGTGGWPSWTRPRRAPSP
jgi:asparagine synthetase B (glutamine-hydrolysing)